MSSGQDSLSLGQLIIIWIVAIWVFKSLFGHFIKPLPIIIVMWLKNAAMAPFKLWGKKLKKPPLSDVHGSARFANEEECKDLFNDGVHLGYFGKKRLGYSGEQHLITFAMTGAGKGATVIIPTLLEYDASMIVIDPAGQAAAVTARARRELGHAVHFINPAGQHGLPDSGFNPLAGLDPTAPNFTTRAALLAEGLILSDGDSSHWTDSARNLVQCLIMWECMTAETPTLPSALLPLGWAYEGRQWQELMQRLAADDFKPIAHLAGGFVGESSRDGPGIQSTARGQTAWVITETQIADSLSRHSFDWAALKRQKTTVYLMPKADELGIAARWFRLLIASALSGLYTPEKPEKPVLFILDEFAQLGRMASIESGIAQARKYGIQFWIIFQNRNQLRRLYGEGGDSFISNAGIRQVFGTNDPLTGEYFSKMGGDKTVPIKGANEGSTSGAGGGFGRTTSGQSFGYSYAETGKPLFSDQELVGLPDNQQVIFKAGLQYPIHANRIAYYHDAALDGRYDPDPYHLGQTVPPLPKPVVWGPAAAVQEKEEGWAEALPTVALWLVVVAGLAGAGWWFSPYSSAPTEATEAKKSAAATIAPTVAPDRDAIPAATPVLVPLTSEQIYENKLKWYDGQVKVCREALARNAGNPGNPPGCDPRNEPKTKAWCKRHNDSPPVCWPIPVPPKQGAVEPGAGQVPE